MSLTLDLLHALTKDSGSTSKLSLVQHAKKNKVLLQLLRKFDEEGALRVSEENSYQVTVAALKEVSRRLTGLRYSLMKFNKPVSYSPADIDLLVAHDEVPQAVRRLLALGYSLRSNEPFCVTLEREVILDLYVHPCAANVPYIDGQILLGHVRETDIAGLPLPSLEKEAESMLTASHALYKEQLFTLNDYLTFNGWFGPLTEDLAREAKVEPAIRISETLSKRVREGRLELPYRLGLIEVSSMLLRKLLEDSQTRASMVHALPTWTSPQFVRRVLGRIGRSTY